MPTDIRDQLQTSLGDAYSLERELSGGGMSRVFVAEERALGRRVVVKVLSPEMAEGVQVERFLREIQLVARLQHPHIVPVLSAGLAGSLPYYTMPYVEGISLRDKLRRGPLPMDETVSILRNIAGALAYAHERGIVHRDIKPDNVLLSSGNAVVADFGIAKALSAARTVESGHTLTQTGTSLGTPSYMAPEQIAGDPTVDQRADIYSLGCVGYELLTGHAPFAGRSAQAIMAAHLTELPRPVTEGRAETPPALADFIMRCLTKDPAMRPQSALELANVQFSASDVHIPAKGTHGAWGIRSYPRARIAAAAIALVLGALGFALWRRNATAAQPAKSIAVLPFASLSQAKEDLPFGEGMAMEISDALGRIPSLNVKGASLAREVAQKESDAQRAGRALGVGSLLQGTIQRSAGRIHVVAQLVSVADGFTQWTGTYDVDFKDIFAVQDTIAHAIAAELRVKLASAETRQLVRANTTNPEAHALYLQGLFLWNKRGSEDLIHAIKVFEQAIAKDSAYVQARAGVAMAYAVLPTHADVDNDTAFRAGARAAEAALAIDSTSAEAHAALGLAKSGLYRNAAATRELRDAIRLDSTLSTAHAWLGLVLARLGRFDEALREGERSRQLDPLSRSNLVVLGLTLYKARRYAEAERTFREVISFDSSYTSAYRSLSILLIEERRAAEAVAVATRGISKGNERLSWDVAALGVAYAANGENARARSLLSELTARSTHGPVSAAGVAILLDALGDRPEGIKWLGRAIADHDPMLLNWSRGAVFDGLRSDPRGAALLAQSEAPNVDLPPIVAR